MSSNTYNQFNQNYPFRTPQPPIAPKPQHKKARRGRILLATFIVIALLGLGLKSSLSPLESKVRSLHLAASASASSKKPASINQAALTNQINQIINGTNMEVGVSITDLTNDNHYDYGLGDTYYIAASTTKLLSATLFLHDVELGQVSLNQPLGDSTAQTELQKMIVISDDDAWIAFNDLLGHPALLQYAHSIGMTNYDPDNNTITSDDMALLLSKLYRGQLLNTQNSRVLLSYMSKADYTQYIGGVIPSGTKFYHKIGYLDDRVMDAAIIDNGEHPYVLVIFTKDPSGTYNQAEGLRVFHQITQATLTVFAH